MANMSHGLGKNTLATTNTITIGTTCQMDSGECVAAIISSSIDIFVDSRIGPSHIPGSYGMSCNTGH